jgi:hypothetical protein
LLHHALNVITSAADNPVETIVLLLTMLKPPVLLIREARKIILASRVALIEKTKDIDLYSVSLSMAQEWVAHTQDAEPTIKEKAVALSKMIPRCQTLGGSKPWNDLLMLAADVYATEAYKGSHLISKLESAFLAKSVHPDAALRHRVLRLLNISIQRCIQACINYTLCVNLP